MAGANHRLLLRFAPTNESESTVRINIGLNAAPETLAIDKDLLMEMTWLVS